MLFAVEGHLGAGVLAEEHAVTLLDVELLDLAVVADTFPLPTATTLPSWGFSLAVSGMMMTSRGGLLLLDALDDDPILKRTNLHGPIPSHSVAPGA